jgi:hypothetical protein
MEPDTAWYDTCSRLRYLDYFQGFPAASFEARDVIDRLLLDLGLVPNRQGIRVDISHRGGDGSRSGLLIMVTRSTRGLLMSI